MKNILWFSEVNKSNVPEVGGKGANLGEMKATGLPVPDGFIVTSGAYFDFLIKTGTKEKIANTLLGLNREDSDDLQKRAKKVQELIKKASMPASLAKEIKENYKKLSKSLGIGETYVAVRSSATAEDLPEASFAGQQATFLNIKGADNVVKAVQNCWASLFEARAIYYREEKGFDHFKVKIAVPVQEMVPSEVSGVMFTVDPVTNDSSKIAIEAGFGLGEAIVGGLITPDRYLVDKKTLEILEKEINFQDFMIDMVRGRNQRIKLDSQKGKQQKLTDEEIKKVAELGRKIEEHYQFPQDSEWVVYKGEVKMVQTRPITTLKTAQKKAAAQVPTAPTKVILKGVAASIGQASGPVRIIHKAEDIDQIKKGDVLVTEMTNPDFVPAMKRAVAIVTDKGGRTSHAAIVSRELGIPCVVGTEKATTTLSNNQIITVDGAKGLVYEGEIAKPLEIQPAIATPSLKTTTPVTATRVYVNLGEPELAEKVASQNVDGVGLLRAEFIISESIGEHPRAMMEKGRSQEFVEKLTSGLEVFASAFYPRPVVYRATDFKTNEYRNLAGGEKYEPKEENPMIGYRGCFRYIKEPDLFNLELEAIKKVRERFANLHLMIPFVRTVEEFTKVKELIQKSGLLKSEEFKLWIMVEVPSAFFLIEKYCQLGINGISIGSNDLTQLTLGLDRDNEMLAELFDERNEAVMESIKHIIEVCKKYNVTSSICGQAPSVYPEVTEKLVEYGITSISVNPDVIDSTRQLVASVEEKLLLKEISEVREELEEIREKLVEEESQ